MSVNETIRAPLIDDLTILLDADTASFGGSFWYDPPRPYDPVPLKWAYDRLKEHESPVLFDVGASTGCYTLLAAHHKGLRVRAFEPVPDVCECLKTNIRLNGIDNRVGVYQVAISDHNGVEAFHVVEMPNVAISMLGGTPREDKTYHDLAVGVQTLDSFVEAFQVVPTLIKVDTEGHELAVLHGAEFVIRTFKPILLVEYSDLNAAQYGYKPEDITALLESWGYTCERLGDDNLTAEVKA